MHCRHCRASTATRPRGLCWPCYHCPDIRPLYPPKPMPHGIADATSPRPPPRRPTTALPGSAAKVEILRRRARRRENLWHPDDAR